MPSIICETQTAFIGGRNIIDRVFIANEVADDWKKAKRQGLIIKLDFEKAFDSVNKEFLFSMLSSFGFGSKWISWMKAWLNILLTRAINIGILKGVLVGANKLILSHFQFDDDSILFCEANLDQVVIIKRILRCFEVLSGLPLGANPGRKSTWKPVLDNLSLFRMPEGVARNFEKIEAAFLWGGIELKRNVHLVKWLKVTKSVPQGSLGIRRIRDVNTCLLLKWVWKDITFIRVQSRNIFNYFLDNCLIKVGDCRKIKFWHDKWCGVTSLKDVFPSLFTLSSVKSGSLYFFYATKTSFNNWNFLDIRALYAWELAVKVRLLALLFSAPTLSLECVDSLLAWAAAVAGSSIFSMSSLYSFSTSLLGPSLSMCKFIWNHTLLPKIHFFGWLA
ncbi:uncharacterized protein LOC114277116 [Camellia sinensis]|uniref:uncharacterized protein LOC114277116 n=1 Tax=Camellia sinensis TaxID=4442 RepID=UPI001035C8CA|nr:uncharacterized protein LOC114277116 [Camellia sinensis]